MSNSRRTTAPWPAWSKVISLFAISSNRVAVSLSVTEQSTYVSVEEAISGKHSESGLQVHGTITI